MWARIDHAYFFHFLTESMKFAMTMSKPEVYGIRHVHHYNL